MMVFTITAVAFYRRHHSKKNPSPTSPSSSISSAPSSPTKKSAVKRFFSKRNSTINTTNNHSIQVNDVTPPLYSPYSSSTSVNYPFSPDDIQQYPPVYQMGTESSPELKYSTTPELPQIREESLENDTEFHTPETREPGEPDIFVEEAVVAPLIPRRSSKRYSRASWIEGAGKGNRVLLEGREDQV